MTWLVRTALRLRVAIVAAAIVLMVAGIRSVRQAPLDVFPEFAPPRVEIQTEGPGLSSEEVEALIYKRETIKKEEYYRQLESLLLEAARYNQQIRQAER